MVRTESGKSLIKDVIDLQHESCVAFRCNSEHDMANLVDWHFQMHKRSPFSLAATKTLLQHLLSALDFIHSNYIIHRGTFLMDM